VDYSEIIPGRLYAGEKVDKKGWRILEQLHADSIVNLRREKDHIPTWFPPVLMLWFPLGNKEKPPVERLHQAVEETIRWLDEGRIIYVHDMAGRNRLGFFLTALFMRLYLIPSGAALRLVKQKRPVVSPRRQFLEVLKEYELTL
jgi:protein-tyrosine phosphatase